MGVGGPYDQSMYNIKELESQKGFKIVHLNIRSLLNKFDQFKRENHNVDIFTVSETWLSDGVSSNILQIKGYDMIRHDRQSHDLDTG